MKGVLKHVCQPLRPLQSDFQSAAVRVRVKVSVGSRVRSRITVRAKVFSPIFNLQQHKKIGNINTDS
jgi:hypothetical protein